MSYLSSRQRSFDRGQNTILSATKVMMTCLGWSFAKYDVDYDVEVNVVKISITFSEWSNNQKNRPTVDQFKHLEMIILSVYGLMDCQDIPEIIFDIK